MLRVEFHDISGVTMIHLEGRFVGRFAEDAYELVLRSDSRSKFVVDLSEVNFVDVIGERVLLCFRRIGMKFTANGSYSRNVCERLSLPLLRTAPRA